MRALLAVVVAMVSSSATADPTPKPGPVEARQPARGSAEHAVASTAEARQARVNPSPCAPGMACVIIDPGPFVDARPYPRGMVIAPPETGDRMLIPLEPWWQSMPRALWQRLGKNLAVIWSSLQPASL
jgi:hypothetical protein